MELMSSVHICSCLCRVLHCLTLKVLVATIDAQWEGMGDVGSVRYEPALEPDLVKWPPLRKTLNFISTTEQDLLFILSCVATMY